MNMDQAIEALIPTIADSVVAQWGRQFDRLVEQYGPSLNGVYNSKSYSLWSGIIRPLCSAVEVSRNCYEYKLSDVKVAAAAQKYAEATANEWRNKIVKKLGNVEYHGFKRFTAAII